MHEKKLNLMATCWDCIFKQTDEYDGTVFCVENGLRIVSDIQGHGNAKPCEKLILRRENHEECSK